MRRLCLSLHRNLRVAVTCALILVTLVGFDCGCDRDAGSNPFSQDVYDLGRSNRLSLIFRRVRSLRSRTKDYNFECLLWRTNSLGRWRDKVLITRQAFQGGRSLDRWISRIGAFDPINGRAVIKVAEESPTARTNSTGGWVDTIYSWREWDLLNNREIRVVRVCKDPFEKY